MDKIEAVMGIDPGQTGAIAILDMDGNAIEVIKLNKPEPEDIADAVKSLLAKYDIVLAGMELVHTMPGQGVVSSGNFMRIKGEISGVLAACDVRYVEVSPQKWKALSPIFAAVEGETKADKKKKSIKYAQERWKNLEIDEKKSNVDICDALCVAEALRTMFLSRNKAAEDKQQLLEEARAWMAEVRRKQHEEREKRYDAKRRRRRLES